MMALRGHAATARPLQLWVEHAYSYRSVEEKPQSLFEIVDVLSVG